MPSRTRDIKIEKQHEALKEKGMSKARAARIANSPGASSRGGKASSRGRRNAGSGSSAQRRGTTAQSKSTGRKDGKATAAKRWGH